MSNDTPQIIPIPSKRTKDLTGNVFGRLTVLGYVGVNKNRAVLWLCLCECQRHHVVLGGSLKNGGTQSCGCLQKESASQYSKRHGMWGAPEYRIWRSMLNRCALQSDPAYPDYGGRGISVCAHWQLAFMNFYADIGARPSPKHSIDRIDVEGHYSCGHCAQCIEQGRNANCQWATRTQQANNTRRNHFLEFQGERLTIAQWSGKTEINARTLHERIATGWSVERALTTPVKKY
jgi:hypothetical protein